MKKQSTYNFKKIDHRTDGQYNILMNLNTQYIFITSHYKLSLPVLSIIDDATQTYFYHEKACSLTFLFLSNKTLLKNTKPKFINTNLEYPVFDIPDLTIDVYAKHCTGKVDVKSTGIYQKKANVSCQGLSQYKVHVA